MTIEEIIDTVICDLTVGFSLPKTLPDTEIRRFIETRAMKYFYQEYHYATSKIYYAIHKEAFCSEEWTKYSYITLPKEIQAVTWIYPLQNASLYQLGINLPNLSVNLGVTNQPYLSSYVSTIGELGVYKTILDSMSDMLNQLNKYTVKYDFNQLMHRLNILTDVKNDLILEAYANIPPENLFDDQYFIKYVTGWSKMQLGNMLGRYDFTLAGGVKYNHADLITDGKEMMKEVDEVIKEKNNNSSFFIMCKR